MNTEAEDLLRSALAFLRVFPDLAPPKFARAMQEGGEYAVTVQFRENLSITVSAMVNGYPVSCDVPVVGSGTTN